MLTIFARVLEKEGGGGTNDMVFPPLSKVRVSLIDTHAQDEVCTGKCLMININLLAVFMYCLA